MERHEVIVRKKDGAIPAEAIKRLTEMLKTVRYGSITLVIQDGRLLQIDKTEKFRL